MLVAIECAESSFSDEGARLFARTDIRRLSTALVIAVAVIAVSIPACQMVGCNMSMRGGMMSSLMHPAQSIGDACNGTWITSASPYGVPPNEFTTILLSFLAAIAAAVVLFSPRVAMQPVRLVDANAPPPPLEPRGERFTV
jgi:hypothetical protein